MIASNPQPITRWTLLFSGFGQDGSQPHGTMKAWRTLYDRFASPSHVVEPHNWNTSPRSLAYRIKNNSNGTPPDIVLGGYSWGAQTAINLAEQLKLCGISVRKIVLADPVFRHRYYAGWWLSLLPWLKIEVPENVREVRYFLQQNAVFKPKREGGWIQPRGHHIVAESPRTIDNPTGKTIVHRPQILNHDHASMDDSREYHRSLTESCQCSHVA